jgi:hypothetical protein
MKTFTEEQILEPLGGWDNLVMMCEAREKRKVWDNSVEFEVADFKVRCGKDLDYLFGYTWSLRISRGDMNIYNTSCISSLGLVRRTFEHYTGFMLEW